MGIVSDRDLRLAANSPFLHSSAAEIMEELSHHKIGEVMRTAVVTIEEDATIVEAAKMMRVRNVGGLPVMNSNGTLLPQFIVITNNFCQEIWSV